MSLDFVADSTRCIAASQRNPCISGEYETMQGWSEDISKVTDFADLPTNAKKYVLRTQRSHKAGKRPAESELWQDPGTPGDSRFLGGSGLTARIRVGVLSFVC